MQFGCCLTVTRTALLQCARAFPLLDKLIDRSYIGPRKPFGLAQHRSAGSIHPVGGSSNGQREGEMVQ
jgi:hypothetical protein